MEQDQLTLNKLLIFSGPGGRNIKLRIAKIIDDAQLQLEILESELPTRKIGTVFTVPILYLMDCGMYKLV
jgi:hypothetical protein